MNPALYALIVILLGIGGCIGYFWTANLIIDKVLFPARGPHIGRNINRANMVRPWAFLFPALFFLGVYLAYPVSRRYGYRCTGARGFHRPWQLQPHVGRAEVWRIPAQQYAVVSGRTRCIDRMRPAGGATDRPHPVGQPSEIVDLYADGDLVRRRIGDLEAGL